MNLIWGSIASRSQESHWFTSVRSLMCLTSTTALYWTIDRSCTRSRSRRSTCSIIWQHTSDRHSRTSKIRSLRSLLTIRTISTWKSTRWLLGSRRWTISCPWKTSSSCSSVKSQSLKRSLHLTLKAWKWLLTRISSYSRLILHSRKPSSLRCTRPRKRIVSHTRVRLPEKENQRSHYRNPRCNIPIDQSWVRARLKQKRLRLGPKKSQAIIIATRILQNDETLKQTRRSTAGTTSIRASSSWMKSRISLGCSSSPRSIKRDLLKHWRKS